MMHRVFDHILIIMFENQYRSYVMQNDYMRNLAAQGIALTNSYGVMHPSQTNYIASISGELCGVNDDNFPTPYLPQKTIVDLIESSPYQLDWRAYMDSYISGWTPWKPIDFTPIDAYPYVLKHNPFTSYQRIINQQKRWQKIDNEAGFFADLLNGTFPEYAWFTPNMWHDGHYLMSTTDNDLKGERAPALVDQQAHWLQNFFKRLNFPGPNSKLPAKTLVVVTYDEADFEADYDTPTKYKYNYDGPNQIYTTLLGDMIIPGQETEGYNHYSLLKTVEKNFNLASLDKNDHDANWFQFLWGKRFRWQQHRTTPIADVLDLQICCYRGQMFIAYVTSEHHLYYRTFNGTVFSEAIHLKDECQQLSMAANNQQLMLSYHDSQQQLTVLEYDVTYGWRNNTCFNYTQITQSAMTCIPHQEGFMLVYCSSQGTFLSRRYQDGQWQEQTEIIPSNNTHPQTNFTLAHLGASLLLIYTNTDHSLACVSYNTAEFNQIQVEKSQYAGPYDDASINQWSPCAFSINHFSHKPSIYTPTEPEPDHNDYAAKGNLCCATLNGVIHLLHNNPNGEQLITETFSINGTLTPRYPVSYNPSKEDCTSNGYGTLAEAGWSEQVAVNGVIRSPDTPLSSTCYQDQLWLFYQAKHTNEIHIYCGGYTNEK
ncbi:alkaline phosphatase family protein [Shewanella surugensis]|uniref:Alkaline phosphatase family protein n=1 Tax=Shewanella surugensis TaxID=212020 RepID=A0ABT0L976_9GAMM|nr:alkaline phosphatase family protein [Shewanella surugensis]MCL1124104.1 alkaline phosphatase family protein [Shewanella surugensis]